MHPKDFPEQFYIDLAVGIAPFADVCAMHRLDPDTVDALEDDPDFRRLFMLAQQAVDDDGSAFRARCKRIASQNVAILGQMILDQDVPASTRLEAFRTLVKYGNMEPEKDAASGPLGPQLVFNIYSPDGTPMIDATLLPTIRQERRVDEVDAEIVEVVEAPAAAAVQGFF